MARHRVVCTEQVPFLHHPLDAKIVAVGIGTDPGRAEQRLTVQQVVAAIDQGHTFYTQSEHSGRIAQVIKYWCAACSDWHIKSSPDAVRDNNLDSLRSCRWQT